jgi:tetratricopeptide (TPR) repeat protein
MASKKITGVLGLLLVVAALGAPARPAAVEEAKALFAAGDYPKALEILNREAATSPRDAAVQYWLARCYFEDEQFDRAISAGEKAISFEPRDSAFHEILGRAYGEKAARSGWWSALVLAKKARREFEAAVQLDERNFGAMQAMIEFDCSAPGIAGGGEDKGRAEIEKLRAMDAAEGLYAAGNCRRQKKDYAAADANFQKALALHPGSADLIYDMGDHYMKRGQGDRLREVVREGRRARPDDPRGDFYRAVADTIDRQNPGEAGSQLRDYLARAPKRNNYPSKAMAHYWLGRLEENRNDPASARKEYQAALRLEPKNRQAGEALKRLERR